MISVTIFFIRTDPAITILLSLKVAFSLTSLRWRQAILVSPSSLFLTLFVLYCAELCHLGRRTNPPLPSLHIPLRELKVEGGWGGSPASAIFPEFFPYGSRSVLTMRLFMHVYRSSLELPTSCFRIANGWGAFADQSASSQGESIWHGLSGLLPDIKWKVWEQVYFVSRLCSS